MQQLSTFGEVSKLSVLFFYSLGSLHSKNPPNAVFGMSRILDVTRPIVYSVFVKVVLYLIFDVVIVELVGHARNISCE